MQTQPQSHTLWDDPKPTALLVLADGTVLEGFGFGAPATRSARSASTRR